MSGGRPTRSASRPPGAQLAALPDLERDAVRARCAELLPDGPFTVTATAWTARGEV